MSKVSQARIIGIDVSRDWLDIHCLPEGKRTRLPNKAEGHERVAQLALETGALVCFETTGGQEWRLWSALDVCGIATRQLPPAQIKAFAASRGTRAKTDRIDAELIARFMMFRPDAGRVLPHGKLRLIRALSSKRGQLVETRKRLLAQIKAHGKLGSADMFEARHRRRPPIVTTRDVPGGARRQPSQPAPENLRRPSSCRRKTTQGCHHSSRPQARHNRKRALQISSQMVPSGRMRNTVARRAGWALQ